MSGKEVVFVRDLHCNSTVRLLQFLLEKEQIPVIRILPGKIVVPRLPPREKDKLTALLSWYGLEPLKKKEEIILEQIRLCVYELVHEMNYVNSVVNRSDYLVEKTGYSYSYLSRLFSSMEGMTLEKYMINEKIKRVKILIEQGEFTLSEIAYMMGYSSVQYLSGQFKQLTGISVSAYKKTVNHRSRNKIL